MRIELDRTAMNFSTTLTGPDWTDTDKVAQLIHEHPCLFGLAAGVDISWNGNGLNPTTSKTGYWGSLQAGVAAATKTIAVSSHLWPIPAQKSIDLTTWKKKFPDVTTNPVRPMCDPVRGGPPDQCSHQHDPIVITRVHVITNLRCTGSTLVAEDVVAVDPVPASEENAVPTVGAPDSQLFDPGGAKRGRPAFVLEWNPANGATAFGGVIFGGMPCLSM